MKLRALGLLCALAPITCRVASPPFHGWNAQTHEVALDGWRGMEQTADVVGALGREMHLLPGLLSAQEIAELHDVALRCTAFETEEADSVDKEPTYQAWIFEDGQPTAGAAEVADLLIPIVEERLLPYVRAKFGCPDACLADVLLRRYQAGERTSLNLHYDVQAFATAIIPLSVQLDQASPPSEAEAPAAPSTYAGGLFVQGGPSLASRRLVRFESPGDVLVHQFDLMHGVDVSSGVRYAVALWFSQSATSRAEGTAPWVRAAAEAGNADAQFVMASFCAQGRFGTPRDESAAARWLERGAAQGHAVSQLGLGRHRLGQGAEAEAAESFRAAAEQGHVEAQYTLALCHLDGLGVAQSVSDARYWLAAAAEQGGEFGEAAALELEAL